MPERISACPEHQPKTPGISEAQASAALQFNIDMIMLTRWRVCANHAQAARHPEMHNHRPAVSPQQQVLTSPVNTPENMTGQFSGKPRRHPLPEAGVAYNDPGDGFARYVTLDPAAGGFYFGKFGHGGSRTED